MTKWLKRKYIPSETDVVIAILRLWRLKNVESEEKMAIFKYSACLSVCVCLVLPFFSSGPKKIQSKNFLQVQLQLINGTEILQSLWFFIFCGAYIHSTILLKSNGLL